jgi:ABC-type sugar transport system substrate-binding protein
MEGAKMNWQSKVLGGFGSQDGLFAIHPFDEKRAKKAIKEAKEAGAGFADFEKEIVWHCYRNVTAPGMLQDHIAKQVAAAKSLWGK